MEERPYMPISCSFYDELEAAATLKKSVKVKYYSLKWDILETKTKITNIYTRNKEEFLVLENGIEFRLDYLISIDDKEVPKMC